MRYEVTHGRDVFQVDVREAGGSVYEVKVDDGPEVRVDAFKTALTTYSILIDHRHYEGSVSERDDGSLDVHVGMSAFDFEVVDERRKMLVGTSAHSLTGKQELRSQMPGKIVKILAQSGDLVEEGQGLIVIEAMKMENELKSPITGVLTQLEVREGDAVETNALLAVIEPPEE